MSGCAVEGVSVEGGMVGDAALPPPLMSCLCTCVVLYCSVLRSNKLPYARTLATCAVAASQQPMSTVK